MRRTIGSFKKLMLVAVSDGTLTLLASSGLGSSQVFNYCSWVANFNGDFIYLKTTDSKF